MSDTPTPTEIEKARATMYERTIGMTLQESDKLRIWIDATLREVDAPIHGFVSENERLRSENEALKTISDTYKSNAQILGDRLMKSDEELDQLRAENERIKKEVAMLNDDKQRLMLDNASWESTCDRVEVERNNLRAVADELAEALAVEGGMRREGFDEYQISCMKRNTYAALVAYRALTTPTDSEWKETPTNIVKEAHQEIVDEYNRKCGCENLTNTPTQETK